MKEDNQSSVSEFLLLGLPIQPEQQGTFFALFLGIYLTTVLGNLLIILLIRLDSHLHTPMYFFLSHLAFTDVSFSSVIAPKMLMNMQTQSQSISYMGCISQVYFFLFFGDIDSLLLTSMAYDRYVAICHPLRYTTIMSQSLCFMLVILSWAHSFAYALLHTLLLAHLSFYGMKRDNQSSLSEFLLLGLPICPEQQGIYYALFLGIYLTTVLENLFIILLIRLDSRLHTPMYFFLSHLALTDISFSSVTAPKMLMNMQMQNQSISYAGCISQVYFFLFFGGIDSFLLTSMAYDRYVAICHPLHYTTIMSRSLCFLLVIMSWVLSFASALLHTLLLACLSFCGDNTIPHFFCDLSALLKLSSSDTSTNKLAILTGGVMVITLPFICILVSYGCIGSTILRVPSTKGICKALSTCGSHLSVVSLYYGAIIGLYFFPSFRNSNDKDVIVAILYTVVTPMLNPFIYSLRNRDMKGALGNILKRRAFSPQCVPNLDRDCNLFCLIRCWQTC
nr:olfactory receptor 50-like isoform X2 [Loxodonta africana]